MPNRLAGQTSPYLLQHAENPVDWHAWGPEALNMAQEKQMPIFLSIGYSACHWCHVMAHESFEDQNIAQFMNKNFISIKVDREERPDIDDVYQRACQMATGQGGWPLSAFLTPEQEPFHIGTYYPPIDSYGRPGFGSVLRQLAQAWKEKPGDIRAAAKKFTSPMQIRKTPSPSKLERMILDEAALNMIQAGDPVYGGFGGAPKFPNSAAISFLLAYGRLSGISKFTKFAILTLQKMARGGIFDQIGGGFHRYSTDARWLVPHFEKMLYDNALLAASYAEGYQVTADPFHLGIMHKTLGFVLREMTSPEGGFYSAQDADSGDGEGEYYVWSKSQITELLGSNADAFCLYYDVTDGGNWEGKTILYNTMSARAAALRCGIEQEKFKSIIADSEVLLLEARDARPKPGLDTKVITSWNALMITAFARGYRVSGRLEYLDAAINCISFIREKLCAGQLLHTYKDGRAMIPGYLDDHAYYAAALLDLFEVSPNHKYLDEALNLGRRIAKDFWDDTSSAFLMTTQDHERLVARPGGIHDLSVPSGNSVAAYLLLRLHRLAGDEQLYDTAVTAMEARAQEAAGNPLAFGHMLGAIYSHLHGAEVTILGSNLATNLALKFMPGDTMVAISEASQLAKLQRYAFFEGKSFKDAPAAFVCHNKTCSPPLHDMADIESHLS